VEIRVSVGDDTISKTVCVFATLRLWLSVNSATEKIILCLIPCYMNMYLNHLYLSLLWQASNDSILTPPPPPNLGRLGIWWRSRTDWQGLPCRPGQRSLWLTRKRTPSSSRLGVTPTTPSRWKKMRGCGIDNGRMSSRRILRIRGWSWAWDREEWRRLLRKARVQ
jgi:hypothetical protein